MSWLFETNDPRGIRIRLRNSTWFRKILLKPIMRGQQNLVRTTIEKPLLGVIYEDTNYTNRNVYYHRWPGRRLYMKVVIRLEGSPPEGEVISAYGQFGCKGGEKPIWPPSLLS